MAGKSTQSSHHRESSGEISQSDEEEEEEEDVLEEEPSGESELEDDADEEEEEEEPRFKFARVTTQLGPVYRNGDATSTFLVAGDKMFIGTHNGNVHVLSLPSFQSIRVYHAHSASITSISVSPFPPPPSITVDNTSRNISQGQLLKRASTSTLKIPSIDPKKIRTTPFLPNVPSNAIYIATSSIDGNICVQSLLDFKDVQLRSFARPVQAVALSPNFKNDRTYISGGSAGNLVLTVGGKPGTKTTSNTARTATVSASGWLGAIGLSADVGKDTVLHSGEGIINTIKWSLSGRYVVWVNEHGIKIMRSNLHLQNADSDSAWRRIGHVDRPDSKGWEEMAGVWKGRVEWIDEKNLQSDEEDKAIISHSTPKSKPYKFQNDIKIEKLLVGWGGTIWIINVHPDGAGIGTDSSAQRGSLGRPEIIKILRMNCIVSGLSLYTPSLLLVLAYINPEEEDHKEYATNSKPSDQPEAFSLGEPRGGIRRRLNALSPELRLIDLNSSEEIDADSLTISRYQELSASDYHLSILPAARAPLATSSRGTFEALSGMGSGMWNATINATSLLNSSSSIRSSGSKGSNSTRKSIVTSVTPSQNKWQTAVHPHLAKPESKIFIHSPFDCILVSKRDLSDHLSWLLDHEKYQESWELIDEHPEIISSTPEKFIEIDSLSHDQRQNFDLDFNDDTSTIDSASKIANSSVEKEKRRIGELWIQQLMKANDWKTAGKVCGQVLKTAQQWEDYVFSFVGAKKHDEIADYIPENKMHPPLKSEIYEIILGHYIARNKPKSKQLLDRWSPELYDIRSVTIVLENQLRYRDIPEYNVEDGLVNRDWRIVMESLGKLYSAGSQLRNALKCYIKLQDADTALSLIKDHHLIDALAEDIPGFILLRVTKQQIKNATIDELKEATSEAIGLLVNEAQSGLLDPSVVVEQLHKKDMILYMFFYISSLWKGDKIEEYQGATKEKLVQDSRAIVDQFADLAVHLFAIYDRELLMDFLKSSTLYTFEKATQECEERAYIPELVYLYSKTGQTKRALYLIIDRLADVSQAISFAKEQNDSDLWEDLLNYSMDKPYFIRGLLEEVGTAINPITLVRRIPEGLQIEGLREGLSKMIKEHEIQHSISYGVAKVLRGEVATVQNSLRSGQQKGIKFDIINTAGLAKSSQIPSREAGHCVACGEPFSSLEMEVLVGFTCGHVWHMSHLLSWQNRSQVDAPPEMDLDWDHKWTIKHSVGVKVTHARLLKDKIQDGCPLCRKEP